MVIISLIWPTVFFQVIMDEEKHLLRNPNYYKQLAKRDKERERAMKREGRPNAIWDVD